MEDLSANKSSNTVKIIPSKSDANRAIICAALSIICSGNDLDDHVESKMTNVDAGNLSGIEQFFGIRIEESSDDIDATRNCMKSLVTACCSAQTECAERINLHCRESGSTLRFILPLIGALTAIGVIDKPAIFHPEGRLADRPLSPLKDELEAHGMSITIKESLESKNYREEHAATELLDSRKNTYARTIEVKGSLKSGDFHLPGNVSSQFISGLLFALPILDGDSRIIIDGKLESTGYVDMTIQTLSQFGIKVGGRLNDLSGKRVYNIPGNQRYVFNDKYVVEGDWSNAAFWFAAGLIGEKAITVSGLNMDSPQGDKKILEAIKSFGGNISIDGAEDVTVNPASDSLHGITFDASETPDIIPVVALIATQAIGETRIINAGRLRLKESDRLKSIATTLKTLGADIEEFEDSLVINRKALLNDKKPDSTDYQTIEKDNEAKHTLRLKGGIVDSFGDHRIAMMCSIASIVCCEKVYLTNSDSVKKSYPGFFDEFRNLGLDARLERS